MNLAGRERHPANRTPRSGGLHRCSLVPIRLASCAAWAVWALLALTAGMPAAWAADAAAPDEARLPELRARELYVPYAEFLKLTGKERDAILMTLEEYRSLAAQAAAREVTAKEAVLPPLKTALMEAVYTGVCDENTARFEAAFKLLITGKEWVRCDLGPALPGWGQITLDQRPAWIVTDGGHAWLLAQGEGLHSGRLVFSVPLCKEEDLVKLSSPLLNASAAVLKLHVPGRNTSGRDNAPAAKNAGSGPAMIAANPLDVQFDTEKNTTVFSLALGRQNSFALQWKRRYDADKNPPLLIAAHAITYLAEPASPLFKWQARVLISRRKTEEFTFREPPGGRIIRLSSPGIHSWQREGDSIRVWLERPTMGAVDLQADGVLSVPPGTQELGCPRFDAAAQETRLLALAEPPDTSVSVERAEGMTEIAVSEASVPVIAAGKLTRVFAADTPGAKVALNVRAPQVVFDLQSTLSAAIDENQTTLRALLSVRPETGRVYALRLDIPALWTAASVQERATGHGVLASQKIENGAESWTLLLASAADAKHPLDLDVVLQMKEPGAPERQTRELTLALPSIPGTRRSRTLLAIAVTPTLEAAFGALTNWTSENAAQLEQTGLPAAFLRACLSTGSPSATVPVKLTRKRCRGEYDLVTHVLTLEREVKVRSDIRLAVMDQNMDELLLVLPPDAKDPVRISPAELVKEVLPGAAANERRVRFHQPWQGVRMLRVEYRAPLTPETSVPIPSVTLDPELDSRRRVVFQSSGAVKLEIEPGAGLAESALDDTPDFAAPFPYGRPLFACVLQSGKPAGTFKTTVLERSPLLNSAVSETVLKTALDASGVSRTHAAFNLNYSRDQYLRARIPADAALLSMTVADQIARPVRDDPAKGTIAIPLPARTSARIELVYERRLTQLGTHGVWAEDGLDLLDVPVGETKWEIHYPVEYAVTVHAGNMLPVKPPVSEFFAVSFWKPLLSGHLPRWTAWEPSLPSGNSEPATVSTPSSVRDSKPNAGSQSLQSTEARQAQTQTEAAAAVSLSVTGGDVLAVSKLGGAPRIEMAYREHGWDRFAKRSLFLLSALTGLALWRRRSKRAALLCMAAVLAIGTALPVALDWHSPLVAVPFCEGAAAAVLLLLLSSAVPALRWLWRKNLEQRRRGALRSAVIFIAAAAGVSAPSAQALESDPVLIPYLPEHLRTPDLLQPKVYVPKTRYLELMQRAFPEKQAAHPNILGAEETTGLAWGNAEYTLTLEKEAYRIAGAAAFRTFNKKEWCKLPLDFGPSQLVSLALDGQPVSAAWDGKSSFLQVQGAGEHTLGVELRGPLQTDAGRVQVRTRLAGGAAVRLCASLPASVELNPRTLPAGATLTESAAGKERRYEINAGGAGDVTLSWHAAIVRAEGASQMTARSCTHLTLDRAGYWIACAEQINVDGVARSHFFFRLIGDWEAASVSAPDLAEWTVTGTGENRSLRVWLQRPANSLLIQVQGWAPLGKARAQVAALSLEGALSQSGFIGIQHGAARRFSASILEGLKRAAQSELGAALGNAAGTADRLYRFHEPPEREFVLAEPEPSQLNVETQATVLLKPDRLAATLRSRFTVTGLAPLSHEADLPPNWTVNAVSSSALRKWEVSEKDGKRRLRLFFTSRAATGTEIVWSGEMPLRAPAKEPVRWEFAFPRAAGTAVSEALDCVFAADSSIELSQDPATTLSAVPLARAHTGVKPSDGRYDYRAAFHSSKNDGLVVLNASRRTSLAKCSMVSFVALADTYAQINTRCRFVLNQSGRERFTFRLPPGGRLVTLDAPRLRSTETQEDPQGVRIDVWLQTAEPGEQLIDIAYRLPHSAGASTAVSALKLEDADIQMTGSYLGILQFERSLVTLAKQRGLEKTSLDQLPFLPLAVSSAALKDVFTAAPDWSAVLQRPDVQAEAGQEAEISLARITTVIAAGGGVHSTAAYTCRNRARQFLQIALPEGAVLWSVTVAGQPVAVSRAAQNGRETTLIPIQRMGLTDLAQEIVLHYQSPRLKLPAAFLTYSPQAPEVLGTPIVETYWQLYVPADYSVSRLGNSNVREVASSVLIGGKLKASAGEVERLLKVADSAESSWTRHKALRNLSRAQQELNDNATELESSGTQHNIREATRFRQSDWEGQMSGNKAVQQKAEQMQQRVQSLDKDMQEAIAGGTDSERAQAFLDRYNFLGNGWQEGKQHSAGKPPAKESPSSGVWAAENESAPRFKPNEVLPPRTPRQEKNLAPLPLRDEPGGTASEGQAQAVSTEVNLAVAGEVFTFRGVQGQPALTVRLVSAASSWRAAAWTALGLLAAAAWMLRRRLRAWTVKR